MSAMIHECVDRTAAKVETEITRHTAIGGLHGQGKEEGEEEREG